MIFFFENRFFKAKYSCFTLGIWAVVILYFEFVTNVTRNTRVSRMVIRVSMWRLCDRAIKQMNFNNYLNHRRRRGGGEADGDEDSSGGQG